MQVNYKPEWIVFIDVDQGSGNNVCGQRQVTTKVRGQSIQVAQYPLPTQFWRFGMLLRVNKPLSNVKIRWRMLPHGRRRSGHKAPTRHPYAPQQMVLLGALLVSESITDSSES